MQTYTVTVDDTGTTTWHNELGQRHRTDGPAVEFANGDREWYVNGDLHRLDGPAVEYADGDQVWYVNGLYHRTDGPAIEHACGNRFWYQNGQRHRLDGPAIELADGSVAYWVNGQLLTKAEFAARTAKQLTVAKVEALLGYKIKIKT